MNAEQKLIVKRPHQASFDTFPKVVKGERVQRLPDDGENPLWFYGQDPRGIKGYFPKGYFTHSADNEDERIALRDYDARELTVKKGDSAVSLEEYGGWRLVRVAGERGWAPIESF